MPADKAGLVLHHLMVLVLPGILKLVHNSNTFLIKTPRTLRQSLLEGDSTSFRVLRHRKFLYFF